jgi:hypothetical protein
MDLILAARAKQKEAKAKGRPAPSAKSLGAPFGGPGAGGQFGTHAKSGASGVTRRTAPGG